jgi:hypothetical protein
MTLQGVQVLHTPIHPRIMGSSRSLRWLVRLCHREWVRVMAWAPRWAQSRRSGCRADGRGRSRPTAADRPSGTPRRRRGHRERNSSRSSADTDPSSRGCPSPPRVVAPSLAVLCRVVHRQRAVGDASWRRTVNDSRASARGDVGWRSWRPGSWSGALPRRSLLASVEELRAEDVSKPLLTRPPEGMGRLAVPIKAAVMNLLSIGAA